MEDDYVVLVTDTRGGRQVMQARRARAVELAVGFEEAAQKPEGRWIASVEVYVRRYGWARGDQEVSVTPAGRQALAVFNGGHA